LGSSFKSVSFRQSYFYTDYESKVRWNNYNIDAIFGYKPIHNYLFSLKTCLGMGIQKFNELSYSNPNKSSEIPLGTTPKVYYWTSIFKSSRKSPRFLIVKLEGCFYVSKNWSFFMSIDCNLNLKKYYTLQFKETFISDTVQFARYFESQPFYNNSVTTLIGFKYKLK